MTDSPFSLAGRVALVTGGNTGLGQGIALALAAAGADIAVAGLQPATETGERVRALGRRFIDIQASLRLSQVSRVSAVRTMRPLLRAVSITDITLPGLDVSRKRKSETFSAVNSVWRSLNAIDAPALATIEAHSSLGSALRVSASRNPASTSRAVFSLRSM